MVNSVESDKSKGFNIGEVVKQTGLSAHTLRYYEKEGLLPFVTKNSSGIRVYTTTDLRWLSMIECLKDSGLQIKEIRQYIEWFRQGDSTLQQRLDLFANRRKVLEAEMARMQVVMNKITFKETLYTTALKLGSLAAADEDKTIMRLKKKLFDSPDDFDKRIQEAG
ncbi:MAG: MerR family transcriptional regulator [Fibrobacter sp.]|nr:MerR family transcriptional regulator [Fibrobacter sp.]